MAGVRRTDRENYLLCLIDIEKEAGRFGRMR